MSADGQVTSERWIQEFCRLIDVEPPTPEQVEELLALAATAAHSSERIAAPLACWAAGRSGRAVSELARAAERVSI